MSLFRDVGLAFRVLCHKPGFTAVAVLTFGLGIAINATVFGWVNSILLRPFGSERGNELLALEGIGADGGRLSSMTHPDFRAYQREMTLASGVVASHMSFFALGPEDHSRRVLGQVVSANLFDVLGVKAERGRMLQPYEDRDDNGAFPVVVISHRLWESYFKGDPSVVGRQLRVNGRELTVVGVAPGDFGGTYGGVFLDVWVPISQITQVGALNTWAAEDYNARFFDVLAKVKPGVTLEQVRAEVQGIAARTSAAHPGTHRGVGATAVPLWRAGHGLQASLLDPLRVLMVVGLLILAISCVNVSNLLMARSVSRQREFAVRMALGAGRVQLARQILTEVLLVSALAAVAGTMLAQWMGEALFYLFPASDTAIRDAVEPLMRSELHWRVLLFTVVIAVGAAVLSALLPVLTTSRVDVQTTLRDAGRGSHGVRSRRARTALVLSEVALAAMALIGAGLAVRTYSRFAAMSAGFDQANVLAVHLYLSTNGYPLEREKAFDAELKRRLESAPGILGASYTDAVPLSFFSPAGERIHVEGSETARSGVNWVLRSVVAPGYFDVMRIPLLEGRDFTEQDDRTRQLVVIVNRTFADRYFGGANPIGRRVMISGEWCRVVGVARDSKYRRLPEGPTPAFYTPFRQGFWSGQNTFLLVRASNLDFARELVRREVLAMGGSGGLYEAIPMSEFTKASLFGERITASLLSVLGILALVLSGIGLYSVMAYTVSERVQELGIRMALGARPWQVLGMVFRDGLAITLGGLAVGVAGALVTVRALALSASEPAVFLFTALPLLAVAGLASLVPALRAVRVSPSESLRAN
jgi:predicted permease